MTLEELHKQCLECQKCGLRSGATQVVPGEGSPNAEIMFIGEGPGKVEDKTGRPFVGPAGKFLDVMLKSIGLERGDIFIANMVKCRPPNNRDPQENEMAACKPWLDKQIELINPRVIVPLGRYAMNKFMPSAVISKEHGKIYARGDKVYFVMYHPAVALYKGSMREVLLKDFGNLKKFIDGEIEAVSLDDVISRIMKEKDVGGDEAKAKVKKESTASQIGLGL
ncbi:MAG: uracil-DNA glycosylase [Patescibacteria group bacterium]|nr:uracil-DNA glycosylase [Patescibacteria group bacterium]